MKGFGNQARIRLGSKLLRNPSAAQFPILAPLIPRQRKALAAVELIRETTNMLIK